MRSRSGSSSYAHEIARKAWEDMRRSKRKLTEDNTQPPQSQRMPNNGVHRPSAAEAASALRLRMEEKRRLKDTQQRNEDDAYVPTTSPKTKEAHRFPIDKAINTKSSSCQTAPESQAPSDSWNHDNSNTSPHSSHSTEHNLGASYPLDKKCLTSSNTKLHSSSSSLMTASEMNGKIDDVKRGGEVPELFVNQDVASLTGNDRVRILADFTEGPNTPSSSGVVDRTGSQLCKRCSPRQIEAQIYGVKSASAPKPYSASPRSDNDGLPVLRSAEEDVLLELHLSLNLNTISEMFTFKKEVAENVARAAGVHSSKIRVEDVSAGRVGIVVLQLAISSDAVDNQGRNTQKIAANLRFQSQNEGSMLLHGKYTCQTICLVANGSRPARKDQFRGDNDGLSSSSRNELSQQVINLLIQVEVGGAWSRGPQEEAIACLRDLIHDKELAERISRDHWALSIMAKPLSKGSDRSQTHCCACFRHLALEDDCCKYVVGAGLKILGGLVSVLLNGSENARQKAAAALGNFAWKSEECRKAICNCDGVIEGLINLLRSREGRSVESALAALSNLTLSQDCSASVGASQQALQILIQELAGEEVIGAGTSKAEIRAAGIIRNLSLDPANRRKLREFPGLIKALTKVGRESQSLEARERVEAALKNLLEIPEVHPPHRPEISFDPSVEDAAIELLHDLLHLHGWNFVQENIFKGDDSASSDRSTGDALDSSHTAKCSFLHRFLTLAHESDAKVVSLKRNGQIVARQDPYICGIEEILLTSLPPSPDLEESATTHEVRSETISSGGSTTSERNVISSRLQIPVSSHPSHLDTQLPEGHAQRSLVTSPSSEQQHQPSSVKFQSNPDMWKAMSTEGILDTASKDSFFFRGTLLNLPVAESDGSVVVRNKLSGEIVYKGPGKHEVYPPNKVNPCIVHAQLVSWTNENGWHDLQRRLIDAGKTDYAPYALYEREMQPISPPAGQSPNSQFFTWRGKVLRLIGESRMIPRRLLDVNTKEILWDFEQSTSFKFPWARALSLTRNQDKIRIIHRKEGFVVVELTLAAPFSFCDPKQRLQASGLPMPQSQALRPTVHNVDSGMNSIAQSSQSKIVVPFTQPTKISSTLNAIESSTDAVRLLVEWTDKRGWYELQRRLFDAGDTDFRKYAEIEPKMQPMSVANPDLYSWEGRTLRLVGLRKKPLQLLDATTGEMIWDFESKTRFHFPWARENFVLIPPKPSVEATIRFQIVSRISGEVIVEYAGGKSGADSLLLQAILMESVSATEKRGISGVQASTAAGGHEHGNQLFHVMREYDPKICDFSPRSFSSQLRVTPGDILLVSQQGTQGWAFGKTIIDVANSSAVGKEGWLPFTYLLPISELAYWRGKLLRILQTAPDSISVCDANTNDQIYVGPHNSPLVEWRISVPSPVNIRTSANAGFRLLSGQQPDVALADPTHAENVMARPASHTRSPVTPVLPHDKTNEVKGKDDLQAAPIAECNHSQADIDAPSRQPLEAAPSTQVVSSASPASDATRRLQNNDTQKLGESQASSPSHSPQQSGREELAHADTVVTPPAPSESGSRPDAHESDAWESNVADFQSIAGSKFLLEGRFRCNALLGDGYSAEETLELHTSGEFEYVGGSAAEDGEKASLVALAGCYKVDTNATQNDVALLLLVEVAAVGNGEGDVGGNGHEVTGVCMRARLIRQRGKIRSIEWQSGYEEMGVGMCGLPLAAEHVICDE